jgi:hypothetical protein
LLESMAEEVMETLRHSRSNGPPAQGEPQPQPAA